MKYLYITLATLGGILIVIYVTGSLLPQSHTATSGRELEAPKAAVWQAVTGREAYPQWRSKLERVEILSDSAEAPRWREYYSNSDPITFEEVSRTDSSKLVTRISDETLPFGGTWTYRLEERAESTLITITENGEVYNPVFRFVSYFIMGHSATMDQYLDDLERHLSKSQTFIP